MLYLLLALTAIGIAWLVRRSRVETAGRERRGRRAERQRRRTAYWDFVGRIFAKKLPRLTYRDPAEPQD